MEHNEAIENHTAERYLLHELTEQERDAYEAHFFSCSACAEEIKAASEFMENARKVVQDELKAHIYSHVARRSIFGSWLNFRMMLHPIPAAACALLVMVSAFGIYQNQVTIPHLREMASAQLVTPQRVVLRGSRDSVPSLTVRRSRGFQMYFDIPQSNFNSYDVSVLTSSNVKKPLLKNVSAEDTKETLAMFVPAGTLDAGRNFLLIEGGNSKGEVTRIPFDIKFQD